MVALSRAGVFDRPRPRRDPGRHTPGALHRHQRPLTMPGIPLPRSPGALCARSRAPNPVTRRLPLKWLAAPRRRDMIIVGGAAARLDDRGARHG